MSTATIPQRFRPREREPSLFDRAVDGEPTLEELLAGVWEGLAVHGRTGCPVCGAAMEARHGAHARPIDGRCSACGSILS